jgi:hypothetical protein
MPRKSWNRLTTALVMGTMAAYASLFALTIWNFGPRPALGVSGPDSVTDSRPSAALAFYPATIKGSMKTVSCLDSVNVARFNPPLPPCMATSSTAMLRDDAHDLVLPVLAQLRVLIATSAQLFSNNAIATAHSTLLAAVRPMIEATLQAFLEWFWRFMLAPTLVQSICILGKPLAFLWAHQHFQTALHTLGLMLATAAGHATCLALSRTVLARLNTAVAQLRRLRALAVSYWVIAQCLSSLYGLLHCVLMVHCLLSGMAVVVCMANFLAAEYDLAMVYCIAQLNQAKTYMSALSPAATEDSTTSQAGTSASAATATEASHMAFSPQPGPRCTQATPDVRRAGLRPSNSMSVLARPEAAAPFALPRCQYMVAPLDARPAATGLTSNPLRVSGGRPKIAEMGPVRRVIARARATAGDDEEMSSCISGNVPDRAWQIPEPAVSSSVSYTQPGLVASRGHAPTLTTSALSAEAEPVCTQPLPNQSDDITIGAKRSSPATAATQNRPLPANSAPALKPPLPQGMPVTVCLSCGCTWAQYVLCPVEHAMYLAQRGRPGMQGRG